MFLFGAPENFIFWGERRQWCALFCQAKSAKHHLPNAMSSAFFAKSNENHRQKYLYCKNSCKYQNFFVTLQAIFTIRDLYV